MENAQFWQLTEDAKEKSGGECEALLYVEGRVYESKTGQGMPEEVISAEQMAAARLEPAGPYGTKWNEADLDTLFPKITAKKLYRKPPDRPLTPNSGGTRLG